MSTSPQTPLSIEHEGRVLTVTDPVHAEKIAPLVSLSEVGLRVYHPNPGVSWSAITRLLES
jgi:hypothetical protein